MTTDTERALIATVELHWYEELDEGTLFLFAGEAAELAEILAEAASAAVALDPTQGEHYTD